MIESVSPSEPSVQRAPQDVSRAGWLWWPICVVAVYTAVLAATAAVGTATQPVPPAPLANLLDKPFGEDAFYMFSVARSIASGQGISYGNVPTTGIQPLATILYAAVYGLATRLHLSDTAPLRAILVLNGVLLLITGWLSGTLVSGWVRERGGKAALAFWVTAIVVTVNPSAFRLFGYGLETGLYLLTIVALQRALDAAPDRLAFRQQIGVGLLLGLCIVARIDFCILGMVVFGWRLLTGKLRVQDAVGIAAVAFVVAAPWFLYVHRVTGSIMPSSGQAEFSVISSAGDFVNRAEIMVGALANTLSVVVFLPVSSRALILGLLGAVLAGISLLWSDLRSLWRQNDVWIAGAVVLACYYFTLSWAGHFYGRYLAPLWLLWAQLAAGAVSLRLGRLRNDSVLTAYHAGACALIALFAIEISYTLHRGHASNSHVYSAFYIREHKDLGTVGAFQSGIVGYMNQERVVNLDGKLDSRALLLSRRRHLECYLAERGIATLVDWPEYINDGSLDPAFVRDHLVQIDRVPGGTSVVMTVRGRTATGCP